MRANLSRMGVPLQEILYALATHYHIDHAGLGQELKLAGVPLLVMDVQEAAIPLMKRFTKPRDHYVEITTYDNLTISCAESRALLERIGIAGQIVHTPGHSDDSVLCYSMTARSSRAILHLWAGGRRVRKRCDYELEPANGIGARRVYPGHGPVQPCPRSRQTCLTPRASAYPSMLPDVICAKKDLSMDSTTTLGNSDLRVPAWE